MPSRSSLLLLMLTFLAWRGTCPGFCQVEVVSLQRNGEEDFTEPDILTVRDEILPMRRWRRVHGSQRPGLTRHLRSYLASIGAQGCRPRHPQTCNNTVLSLVSKFLAENQEWEEPGLGRRKRSPRELSSDSARSHVGDRRKREAPLVSDFGSGDQVSFRFFNAVPDGRRVSASLIPNQNGYLPGRLNYTSEPIEYGMELEDSFPLILDDAFAVAAGEDSFSSDVAASIFRIPERAEFFLISDVGGSTPALHSSLVIFDRNVKFNGSWLLTYNALYHGANGKPLCGIDVLLFDASKFGLDFSVYLIARNISLHEGQEATVPEGKYEVKVVPTDSVISVNAFKNVPSLVPPMYIDLDVNVQRYNNLILKGDVSSAQYQPGLSTIPDVDIGDPPALLPTETYILNSDSLGHQVSVSFSGDKREFRTNAGVGREELIPVRRNDRIILNDTRETYEINVTIDVPYAYGSCVLLIDRSRSGRLEGFFACWHDPSGILHPSKAWIFTYNALVTYTGSLEVIIYNPEVEAGDYSLFSIAHGLFLGQGVPAEVDIGTYMLKVVPSGSVQNSVDFMRVASIIEPTNITLLSRRHYYASVWQNERSGSYISAPLLTAAKHSPQPTIATIDQSYKGSGEIKRPVSLFATLLLVTLSLTIISR